MDNHDLLRDLNNIVNDLWGMGAGPVGSAAPAQRAAAPMAAEKPDAGKPDAGKPAAEKPLVPEKPVDTVMAVSGVADEPVEWTLLLAGDDAGFPYDSDTRVFCASQAEAVLKGDTAAYEAVLKRVRPLHDLAGYTAGISAQVISADRVEARYEAKPEAWQGVSENAMHAALCLRIARDLMALLPLREVEVTGCTDGAEKAKITFPRDIMRRLPFGLTGPEEMIGMLG